MRPPSVQENDVIRVHGLSCHERLTHHIANTHQEEENDLLKDRTCAQIDGRETGDSESRVT